MMLATGEMLRWLGARHDDARLVRGGDAIEAAVAALIAEGTWLTADLAGRDAGKKRSEVAARITAQALAALTYLRLANPQLTRGEPLLHLSGFSSQQLQFHRRHTSSSGCCAPIGF